MDLAQLEDVLYEVERGIGWITINRPARFNAFRARTVDELVEHAEVLVITREDGQLLERVAQLGKWPVIVDLRGQSHDVRRWLKSKRPPKAAAKAGALEAGVPSARVTRLPKAQSGIGRGKGKRLCKAA